MRSVAVLLAVAWSSAALAQSPAPPVSRFVTEDVQSFRFPDDATVNGPALEMGESVQVVYEEGNRVRIKRGTAFGWVPATALSELPPVVNEPPPAAPE